MFIVLILQVVLCSSIGGSPVLTVETRTHDASGNMTLMSGLKGKYDAWNRLVGVKDSDNSTKIVDYSYNGLNHRIVKKTYTSGTLTETRNFYFNSGGWQCLEERIGSTVDQTYVWGLRYIDDLICRDKESERLYSVADANWNVVALCDSSGTVQERYTYSSFGKSNIFTGNFSAIRTTSAYDWTRTFTGQVFDVETGLMVYRNRFYHTGLGRFVTRDPIGYGGRGLNLYRYVKNSVTFFVDPMGYDFIQPNGLASIMGRRERLERLGLNDEEIDAGRADSPKKKKCDELNEEYHTPECRSCNGETDSREVLEKKIECYNRQIKKRQQWLDMGCIMNGTTEQIAKSIKNHKDEIESKSISRKDCSDKLKRLKKCGR